MLPANNRILFVRKTHIQVSVTLYLQPISISTVHSRRTRRRRCRGLVRNITLTIVPSFAKYSLDRMFVDSEGAFFRESRVRFTPLQFISRTQLDDLPIKRVGTVFLTSKARPRVINSPPTDPLQSTSSVSPTVSSASG